MATAVVSEAAPALLISAVAVEMKQLPPLPPLLLPWLPGRPFAIKGALVGLAMGLGIAVVGGSRFAALGSLPSTAAWLFMCPALVSFLAMNFTGCTTFTSLSGVRAEMRVAVPVQIAFAVVGLGLWLVGRFTGEVV